MVSFVFRASRPFVTRTNYMYTAAGAAMYTCLRVVHIYTYTRTVLVNYARMNVEVYRYIVYSVERYV